MAKKVYFEGNEYVFPNDLSDEQIKSTIAEVHPSAANAVMQPLEGQPNEFELVIQSGKKGQ